MILCGGKADVVRNIEANVGNGEFNRKTEEGDARLSPEQEKAITDDFLASRGKPWLAIPGFAARKVRDFFAWWLNRDTIYVGLEKLKSVEKGPAIVTSNHFCCVRKKGAACPHQRSARPLQRSAMPCQGLRLLTKPPAC